MSNPYDHPTALSDLQDSIYREKILRARAMTREERIAEAFDLSNRQLGMMLAGAMAKIVTNDEILGWKEVSKNLERLDRVRDFKLYSSTKPANQLISNISQPKSSIESTYSPSKAPKPSTCSTSKTGATSTKPHHASPTHSLVSLLCNRPLDFQTKKLANSLPAGFHIRPVTKHRTDDLRISGINPLISPAVLAYYLPINEQAAAVVHSARAQADDILLHKDDRLMVVVGPCSIHDPEAAVEYAVKLKAEAERLKEDLFIIMRVYFEKPRTTVGWKGLINDPKLDDSFDINQGLRVARKLLLDLANMGIASGTEFLDTISPQYIADLIAWGAIGARTTESQIHRELASGLSMPVGFKNGTGGSIQLALDAIQSASRPHHFLSVTKQGVSAIVSTTGNTSCHLILRGGKTGPNYDSESIVTVEKMLTEQNLPHSLMVDCSHGNSNKDYRNQPLVAKALANQIADGSHTITSVMIESNLVEGNQKLNPDLTKLTRGQSVTDACINWDDTVETLEVLAEAVRKRRSAS